MDGVKAVYRSLVEPDVKYGVVYEDGTLSKGGWLWFGQRLLERLRWIHFGLEWTVTVAALDIVIDDWDLADSASVESAAYWGK